MKGKWILKGIGFAVLTGLAILGFGYVFMYLWNWLMPPIFGLGVITWCQGIGLLILGKMLFGGFRSKWGRGGCGHGHCGSGYGGRWKNKWNEKMMNMTPEEREKFKMKMKEKCGGYYFKEEDEPKQEA